MPNNVNSCPRCGQVFYRATNYQRHQTACRRHTEDSITRLLRAPLSSRNVPLSASANKTFINDHSVLSSLGEGTIDEENASNERGNRVNDHQTNDTFVLLNIDPNEENDCDLPETDASTEYEELEDVSPEDLFGMTLINESFRGNDVVNNDSASSIEDLEVTYLQWKAAHYILTSGASLKGLSVCETSSYLNSLQRGGDVREKWRSARAFWDDHRRRQSEILPTIGKWKVFTMSPTKPEIPTQIAYIRDMRSTVKHIIESARNVKYTSGFNGVSDWNKHLTLHSNKQYNKNGDRILNDWYSGDDLRYMEAAIGLDEHNGSVTSIPLQLFIDKANVTRLNKRAMYPVVLYVLCFSRSLRRLLAVNVAFIPFVSKFSTTGGHLSPTIVKVTRNSVLQATIRALLSPLRKDAVVSINFPDGVRRRSRPLLLSLVMDLPEAAVCLSRRFGMSTRFSCPRCFVPTEQFGDIDLDVNNFKTAQELMEIYDSIAKQRLKGQQQRDLQNLSLRLPPSAILQRYECHLDCSSVRDRLPHSIRNLVFSYHSMTKFEAMHNFDLGITKDTLEAIPRFLALELGPSQSTQIVGVANSHHAALPRRSQTGMFRMPSLGTAIADSHANLTAQNYFSVLSVLPFLLRGSSKGYVGGSKSTFDLIRFFLSYLDMHLFVRRINCLPWHIYETFEAQLKERIALMSLEYTNTIGKTRGNEASRFLGTPKAHQLFYHLIRDIKGAGNVQEYDAQSEESHHVGTRAHYQRSSKRKDAEREVALRSTTREIGVLRAMYPLCEGQDGTDAASDDSTGDSPVETSDRSDEENETPVMRNIRAKFERVTPALVDGMSEETFQVVLREWCADEIYRHRATIRKVRASRTLKIKARYPWIQQSGEDHPSLKILKGMSQKVRAATSFYGPEPQYDFVEVLWRGQPWMAQLRLLFYQPYSDKLRSEPILCLVRLLEPDPVRAGVCNSDETYWEDRAKRMLESYGCCYYRWWLEEDGSIRRVIVSSKDILRSVSVVPDFSLPFNAEPGSTFWVMQRARRSTSDVTNLVEPCVERFFYNRFMPWTAP